MNDYEKFQEELQEKLPEEIRAKVYDLLHKTIPSGLSLEEKVLFDQIVFWSRWCRDNFMGVLSVLQNGATFNPEEAGKLLENLKSPYFQGWVYK